MSLKDRILGREKLKRRVESLESEIEDMKSLKRDLERKASKEEKRAKEAVSKMQGLHEEINRKKDRIKSLEDKITKKDLIEKAVGSKSGERTMGRQKTKKLLEKIENMVSSEEDLLTVSIPSGSSLRDIDSDGFIQTSLTLNQLKRLRDEKSETGKVFFHCPDLFNILLKPPIPVQNEDWHVDSNFDIGLVSDILQSRVGFVFLSAGGSAVAVFGDTIEDYSIVKSSVKSKHKKGGFSQDRFKRSRDEDIKNHIEKTVKALGETVPGDIGLFAVSGSKKMVSMLTEHSFFEDRKIFERSLNLSRIVEEDDLKKAFREFWSTEVTHL